jgi:hypothetical protein
MLEIDPVQLGTVEMGGSWVPYLDLYDAEMVPTRLKIVNDEYAFTKSAPVRGHGAVLPDEIRAARTAGKKPIGVERGDRYYLFVTPP